MTQCIQCFLHHTSLTGVSVLEKKWRSHSWAHWGLASLCLVNSFKEKKWALLETPMALHSSAPKAWISITTFMWEEGVELEVGIPQYGLYLRLTHTLGVRALGMPWPSACFCKYYQIFLLWSGQLKTNQPTKQTKTPNNQGKKKPKPQINPFILFTFHTLFYLVWEVLYALQQYTQL